MAADDGARAGDRRQLVRLMEFRGRDRVLEILGADDGTLDGLLDGSLDWPADAREKFDNAWRMMEMLGATAEVSGETPEPGPPDEPELAAEVEEPLPGSGGDAKPAGGGGQAEADAEPAAASGGEMVQRRRAEAAAVDEHRLALLRRDILWRARYLVVTQYLWPERGVSRQRRLSAWAVVLRLEIELIRGFQVPLPRLWQRGESWDSDRRQREISLRLDRLRDVKQREQHLLLRRLADWMLGRDEDRDEVLLRRMLDDAWQRGPVFEPSLLAAEPDWREFYRLAPPGP